MDQRTRKKYLQAARVMLHMLEGHHSRLPKGKTLQAALAEGIAAAQALGFDAVGKEERAKGAAEAAARFEVLKALPVPTHPVGRGIEALYVPFPAPSCGIERSLPRGDM
ncbi:hypothetical protein [Desulfovibrio intestinalis]|uniref:Uncharacterized protein n=1 Tax=Desulfovibrio intestinalis TaxID=58621 RepID=A0A7W8FGH6_9BACT|nr:hypothetical protein [Desulfovibrio intestinalis]MBB5143931.1 hypothetical protein [Desulfovibrio intestinalis]